MRAVLMTLSAMLFFEMTCRHTLIRYLIYHLPPRVRAFTRAQRDAHAPFTRHAELYAYFTRCYLPSPCAPCRAPCRALRMFAMRHCHLYDYAMPCRLIISLMIFFFELIRRCRCHAFAAVFPDAMIEMFSDAAIICHYLFSISMIYFAFLFSLPLRCFHVTAMFIFDLPPPIFTPF